MSTNIELLSVNNKLIQIQNDVREFFNWDIKLDEDSAIELLSTVENSSIDVWTRSQRLVTLANLRRRLVLRLSLIHI